MTAAIRVNPIETSFAAAALRARRLEAGRPAAVTGSVMHIFRYQSRTPGIDAGAVPHYLLPLTKYGPGEYSEPNRSKLIQKFTLILFVLLYSTVIICLFFEGNADRLVANEWISPEMPQQIQAIEGKVLFPTLTMPLATVSGAQMASPTVNLASGRAIGRDSR